jgi:hypothetical protein
MMATLPLIGFAAPVPPPATPGAFIDVDNNGVWTSGDLPLANFTGTGSVGFNAFATQPGWKPVTRPVGLVVLTPLTLNADFVQQFIVSGDIRIMADVKVSQADTFVSFSTIGGNITIGPKVSVSGNGDMDFQTFNGGDISVGDGASFTTRGEFNTVSLDADGVMTLGSKLAFQLAGTGYNAINIHAHDAITIGPGMTTRIPNHGYFDLLCNCDVTLPKANFRSGYIRIEGYSSARHPEAKHVRVTDSTLTQTYKNGDFRIIAGADVRTSRYAPDGLILEKTKISTKSLQPLYLPDPIVR